MNWIVEDRGYRKEDVEFWGSKYLLGNGYMGYRGTLEEYGKEQLCACTLAGIYNKNGEKWREPVNMPNPFSIRVKLNGESMSVLEKKPESHIQRLDMFTGRFIRETSFQIGETTCTIYSERFLSRSRLNMMALKYRIQAEAKMSAEIEIKLDRDIWDINGPHLEQFCEYRKDHIVLLTAKTSEQKRNVITGQMTDIPFSCKKDENGVIKAVIPENGILEFYVYGWEEKDAGAEDIPRIMKELEQTASAGYEELLKVNTQYWEEIWEDANILIDGDEDIELAVRYSLYQLISSAPFHTDETAIPARGLSGQVYKGAMFWDTEMFMLPFFTSTFPDVAKNLVGYRIRTLDGAKRKAQKLGYQGAFYAWESQDTGDEACTKYGFTDVFTGRPLRTYFGDKQIHISADVAYGIWKYYEMTGDRKLLLDGGLETMTECIRFLYDYSVFKERKNRYELFDVTSPDEYHERNNNDAYTNILTKEMAEKTFLLWKEMEKVSPEEVRRLKSRLFDEGEWERLERFAELLYIPEPGDNGVIEQCDGYFDLEDIEIPELLKRKLNDSEYLGGANGIASPTQIIKQADVVLATTLLKQNYKKEIREKNWKYYEPRTEHGSSLSACIYALGAIDASDTEKAYRYLEKTAYTDLKGDYKIYVGNLYIGGVHTAANGGAWLVTIQGFAGTTADEKGVHLAPRLPKKWNFVAYTMYWKNQKLTLKVEADAVKICASPDNTCDVPVDAFDKYEIVKPGQSTVFAN